MIDFAKLFHDLAGRLEATAKPAFQGDAKGTIAQVAADLHDGAEAVAAAVTPGLPAELSPFVPDILAFLDGKIVDAQAAAKAEVDRLTAAKAVVAAKPA